MQKQTETLVRASEIDQLQDMPTFSVDRALGHFLEIGVNFSNLVNFYENLPHQNKPPLSELTIHLSASPVKQRFLLEEDTTNELGVMAWDGTKDIKEKTTPELPKTSTPTIIVYVGSYLDFLSLEDDPHDLKSRLIEKFTQKTITHELAHYAQGPIGGEITRTCFSTVKDKLTTISYAAALSALGLLVDRGWAKTGSASFVASEALTNNGWPNSLKIALGAAALTHITGRKKRLEKMSHDPKKSHDRYLKKETEVDARSHEDSSADIFHFNWVGSDDFDYKTISIHTEKGMRANRYLARHNHRELSQKPPNR